MSQGLRQEVVKLAVRSDKGSSKKTTYEWLVLNKIYWKGYSEPGNWRVKILDPDGWNRNNLEEDMLERISQFEFAQRLMMSTTQFRKGELKRREEIFWEILGKNIDVFKRLANK